MANRSLNGLLPAGLVDPAIEALSVLSSSPGTQYRKTIYKGSENEKNVMVLLSRSGKTESWGFLTFDKSFPLRVGAITSDVASRLQKGDEIIAINKLVPESYEDAMQIFRRARLHLELRVCRLGVQDTRSFVEGDGVVAETAFIAAGGARQAATPCSFSLRSSSSSGSGGAEATLPPSCTVPDLQPNEMVRHSAQVALDNVLRVERERCLGGGGADMENRHVSPADAFCLAFCKHPPEMAWQFALSRKRNRMLDVADDCAYANACCVLPRPARQAIYDRSNCPFSEVEGFTTDFHNAVQYIMTQQALLHGRDVDTQGPQIIASLAGRDCSRRDPAALLERIEDKLVCRDEEIKRHQAEEGFAQRRKELAAVHGAMLRVVPQYYAMRERQRTVEAEMYHQAEHAAQEFLAAYTRASSLGVTVAKNGWQKSQQQPRANNLGSRGYEFSSSSTLATAAGKARHSEHVTSRLMRLPTPPPPSSSKDA